jgi:hypothetical protein
MTSFTYYVLPVMLASCSSHFRRPPEILSHVIVVPIQPWSPWIHPWNFAGSKISWILPLHENLCSDILTQITSQSQYVFSWWICGSHCDNNEDDGILDCDAVYFGKWTPMFRCNLLPPFSEKKCSNLTADSACWKLWYDHTTRLHQNTLTSWTPGIF